MFSAVCNIIKTFGVILNNAYCEYIIRPFLITTMTDWPIDWLTQSPRVQHRHWIWFWASLIKSKSLERISLRYILILFSHPFLCGLRNYDAHISPLTSDLNIIWTQDSQWDTFSVWIYSSVKHHLAIHLDSWNFGE